MADMVAYVGKGVAPQFFVTSVGGYWEAWGAVLWDEILV